MKCINFRPTTNQLTTIKSIRKMDRSQLQLRRFRQVSFLVDFNSFIGLYLPIFKTLSPTILSCLLNILQVPLTNFLLRPGTMAPSLWKRPYSSPFTFKTNNWKDSQWTGFKSHGLPTTDSQFWWRIWLSVIWLHGWNLEKSTGVGRYLQFIAKN